MFDRRWIIRPENIIKASDPASAAEMAEAAMLRLRGIDPADVNAFFAPSKLPPLPEDSALETAADMILSAVDESVRIAVFGDYDCDGICATAILYHFLVNYLEADAEYHIPDRFGEGYGISPDTVEKMYNRGVGLIITVDNGITAHEAAKRAREYGIRMIVTDHHLSMGELPDCDAVIDPHLDGSTFDFHDECGAGVAFTLIRRIGEEIGIGPEELEKYLMCVAVATVGDSVPLIGTNRVYVRFGIDLMGRLMRSQEKDGGALTEGIRAVLEASGIKENGVLTSTDLAFKVVPKINAAGRMGSAEGAIALLLSETAGEARDAAEKLISDNNLRKSIETEIFADALTEKRMITTEKDSIRVSIGEDWHQGVLGIVASRIADRFGCPAFVLTLVEDGEDPLYKGSGRSVEGIDIYGAILSGAGHLERFGGHTRAAGISVRRSEIPAFIRAMNDYFAAAGEKKAYVPEYAADAMIGGGMLDAGFADMVNAFEPFGEGNKSPLFIVTGLRLTGCQRVGADNAHLKLSFSATGPGGAQKRLDGIAFRCGNLYETVRHMSRVSVLCTPKRDAFRPDLLSLSVTDIHDFDTDIEKTCSCMYNTPYITFESFAQSADFLRAVYRGISKLPDRFTFNELIGLRSQLIGAGQLCSWYRLKCAVDIFEEIGLVKRLSLTEFSLDRTVEKANLSSSPLFRALTAESDKNDS